MHFYMENNNEVVATHQPFMEFDNLNSALISGLSTTIVNLAGSFNIGVKTDRVSLAQSMTASTSSNIVDIVVTKIPTTISVGGSIRVGSGNTTDTEVLKVLELYDQQRVIRALRNTGIAHTLGSNIDFLNTSINIPVKTKNLIPRLMILYISMVNSQLV